MSKRRNKQERKTEKPTGKIEAKIAAPKGWNSMTNWLMVLVFVLPIIFSRETLDPAITPRYIFLGSFILLFLLFFFAIKKTTFVIAGPVKIVFALGIAFGIWSILSSFSAINPTPAYYEIARHFLNLILLFLVYVTVQKEEFQLLKICKAILLMSFVQSFVGIMQFYELAFDDLPGANAKPFGLMSNRNLFGSAQTLVLPFVIYVLHKGRKEWKYTAIVALLGILVSILISQTRSAWLSTIVLMLVALVLVIIFSKANLRKWIIGYVIATFSIVAFVALLLTGDKEGELTKSIKERTSLSASTTESVNTNERVRIWEKTIELIKDHPVFGVGTGNWKLSIPLYGTEGLAWARGFYVPDRTHNVYLQVSAETGLPGAILYFGMWIAIGIIALKSIMRKVPIEDQRILVILMLSGLAAFATDCLFSFPTERIEHSLYICLTGGIILGTLITKGNDLETRSSNNLLMPVLLLITLFNIFLGYKKYNFEKHMNYAKAYENNKNYQEELNQAEAGKNLFVTIDQDGKSLEIRSSIAYTELKDFKNALIEINKAKKYHPNSPMIFNNLGTIYTEMKEYNKAIENYLKALKLAPKMDMALKNLAINYFNTENYAATIEALNKVEDKVQDSALLKDLLNEAKRRLALQSK